MISYIKTASGHFLLSLFLILGIYGCKNADNQNASGADNKANHERSGGLFKLSYSEDVVSLFPHNLIHGTEINLMNLVYEGLFSLDEKTNEVIPELADSYTLSADKKTYTIRLKEGIYFHDDPIFPSGKGREVKAADVVFCFTKLCEPSRFNALYPYVIDLIKGAREYRQAIQEGNNRDDGPVGLRLVDEYSFEIELINHTPNFLAILTNPGCWIFPKELYEYEGQVNNWCIGTGPFKAYSVKMNDVIIFQRNQNYRMSDEQGRSLPYLDAVRCNFVDDESEQFDAFFEGSLDLIMSLPRKEITKAIESSKRENSFFNLLSIPMMGVEYYGFQHRNNLFSNEAIRKSINHAIDREFLVDSILMGFGKPALNGFVPPSAPGYNAENIEGYTFDPVKAREYLKAGGFDNPQDFPVLSIQVNDDNPLAFDVAEAVQNMLLQHLGITAELAILPRGSHYEEIESGRVPFWRDGWVADYPDPENFLKLFDGKLVPEDSVRASYLNTVRFKDDEFDHYFEESTKESDREKRHQLLLKADSILIDKAAVVPLYYEERIWLVNKRVENLLSNSMGEFDLTRVYMNKEE